jgi:hypothetical protein
MACFLSWMAELFGATAKLPASEPIVGAEVVIRGGEGINVYVQLEDVERAGVVIRPAQQLHQATNADGQVFLGVEGMRISRAFSFHVSAQPEAVTAETLIEVFLSGLEFGAGGGGKGVLDVEERPSRLKVDEDVDVAGDCLPPGNGAKETRIAPAMVRDDASKDTPVAQDPLDCGIPGGRWGPSPQVVLEGGLDHRGERRPRRLATAKPLDFLIKAVGKSDARSPHE